MTLTKTKPRPRAVLKTTTATDTLFRGQDPSLWKLWDHGVTSSFLGSFLGCLEQTRLSYVEGWSSKTVPLALEFGTCCHWVLEQAYGEFHGYLKGMPRDQLLIGIDLWVKGQIKQYEAKWLKEVPEPTSRQLEQQELVYGLAEALIPNYLIRWDGDWTGEYVYGNNTVRPASWVSLEKVFAIPYTYPDGRRTVLRGRRDGVFKDRTGRLWVFDTKCRSVINDDDILDLMHLDLQQMLYLYVTYREQQEQGTKNPFPVGMVLNVLRRPGQRRLKDESLTTFLVRVRRELQNPKRFDHYFIRYELVLSPQELLTWKRDLLDPVMQTVRRWWEGDLPHFVNPYNLISKYGRCSLFLPIVKGVYDHCYRRKFAFNELQ